MLHLHRAERADRLVAALAEVLAAPLDDPFTPEVVSVPTRGVERWLAQQLSTTLGAASGRADGVCANIDFPFPGHLVGGALARACGVEPDVDPWRPERAVWPLLGIVADCLDDEWLSVLAAHLGHRRPAGGQDIDDLEADDLRRHRRFATVRRIADLFDRYAVHRPAMLRAWAAGDDVDHTGAPLAHDVAWQGELWRCLRARLDLDSPAERLVDACDRLRANPDLTDLPQRLALFGLTRLPASFLDVLRALSDHRDVHLFLLHPSPALWDRVAQDPPAPLPRRADDTTAELPRNPLLATWGQDAREMQLVLLAGEGHAEHHRHRVQREPSTLLRRLQADVREDRPPPGVPLPGVEDPRPLLDATDTSVQVHACHGRARQVEVLRDALLHLLADTGDLEPRDIVVMCPDIEEFAPLIHATFGAGGDDIEDDEIDGADRPPDLRVRLADRSLRQTNPVLGVAAELLSLASARLTASQVADLASREPVRRRFRLDDDDLARIEEWTATAGVRWGLDADHRAPFKLQRVTQSTWRAGLDRLLVGVAMSEEDLRLVSGVLPLDDVDSGDIDLAGRLAELVDRLAAAVDRLARPQPLTSWAEAIAAAADALTATADADTWQRRQLQRLLDDVVAEAATAGASDQDLSLPEIRALLGDRLRGRPTRASFRTGHLTVCTLVPMRSVPHRVVCLLGLDDEVFPRKTIVDGDDLVDRDPRVGDRDARSEDRQLLLDALLAAGDHLLVTYSGRDERTNAPRPPAVPIGELLDVVDRTVRTADGDRARDRVVIHHPLQGVDPRNFTPGLLVRDRPWSFDRVGLAGASAAQDERSETPDFLRGPLPPLERDLVPLDDLVRFVQHPGKAFLRQRLGVVLTREDPEPEDALPIELDGLDRWTLGDRLVQLLLAGTSPQACLAAEVARGQLPPGRLGKPVIDEVGLTAQAIAETAAGLVPDVTFPTAADVHVELGGGRTLAGTVTGLYGDLLRVATYSQLGAKHRLAAWVRLLALTATDPVRPFASATVGRGSPQVRRLAPLVGDADERRAVAIEHLRVVVDLHDRGLREPLPLFCATSGAYAEHRWRGGDGIGRGRWAWTSGWSKNGWWSKEDEEREHVLALGRVAVFEDLLRIPPCPGEDDEGWFADAEESRFGRYSRRLWEPLLTHERVRP